MKKQTILVVIVVLALHFIVIFGLTFEPPQAKYNKIVAGIPMDTSESFQKPKSFNVALVDNTNMSEQPKLPYKVTSNRKYKWQRTTQPYIEIRDNKVTKRCTKEFKYSEKYRKYLSRLVNCQYPQSKKKNYIQWSQ